MRGRCVALVTLDPVLYAELASALRERKIPTVSLLPGQRIPDRAAVVLTSALEAKRFQDPRVLSVGDSADRTALWAAVMNALEPGDRSSELTVGIDPGPRPGYAVISDGRPLVQGNLESPEAAAQFGATLRRRFPTRPLRFRVGRGDPTSRNRILASLVPLRRPIELVDERGTTPAGRRRARDAIAALAIAVTPGELIEQGPPVVVTGGEVANVQRLSREGSGGQFTIPRALARRVARGELTLNEALAEGARRYHGVTQPRRARVTAAGEPS